MLRSTRSLAVSIVTLLALTGACGARGGSQVSSIADGTDQSEVVSKDLEIEVINQGFRDSTVYLQLGGSRQRLGYAGGNRTSTFKVKWNAQLANAVDVTLTAERIGDDTTLESSRIQLMEGARIVWTVSGHFNQTALEVY